jgi:hypothetical protein
MIIAGIISLVIGAILLFVRMRSQNKLLEIQSTPLSSARDITDLAASVTSEIGRGGFRQYVSVAGRTRCGAPLVSELAQKECVYYAMNVEERYEESYTETDSNGRTVQKTRTSSSTVASNTRCAPFEVEDESGAIAVDADHAKVIAEKVVDKYEPAHSGMASLSFGGFSFNLGGSGGRRILGYHYTESIIPIGASVYVIGEASDAAGAAGIGKPQEKGKPFLVALGTRDTVVSSRKTNIRIMLIVGAILLAAGAILIAVGLAQ